MIQRKFFNITMVLALTLTIDIATSAGDETRTAVPVQGIHQRGCGAPKKDYNFITEYKRLPQYRYVAAYKRFPDYLYSFGIGKRFDDSIKRTSPYSFGVGKRNTFGKLPFLRIPVDFALPVDVKNYPTDLAMDDLSQIKRMASSHAYGFGIGKRDGQLSNEESDDEELNGDKKLNGDGQWDQYQ